MNSPEIKASIRKHSALFWYIPEAKKEDIDEEVLVEFILNYGNLDSVKELFALVGIENVAKTFYKAIDKSERSKGNYHELTLNYFTLLFDRYAHRNSVRKSN